MSRSTNPRSVDDLLDDEFAHHLDELTNWLIAKGMSPEAARREAESRFGSQKHYRARCQSLHEPLEPRQENNMISDLKQDIGYAVRGFRRSPGFTAVVVLTLALGIGANTAIFSVVRGVLLRPLGFDDPEMLAAVWDTSPVLGVETSPTSSDTYVRWRDESTTLQDLAGWNIGSVTLEDPNESVVLTTVFHTGNYLSLLGVQPVVGRVAMLDDEQPGQRGTVALISYALWRDRFGADPAVIGNTLALDGTPTTVIGVMPANHLAPSMLADLWLPFGFQGRAQPNHGVRTLNVVARLRPQVTFAQARAEIAGISERIAVEYPSSARDWAGTVIPMREQIVGSVRSSLVIALGAVGVLLLIACTNIANLLLARAATRDSEIALRQALGAGRRRIVKQFVTESLVTGAAGGLVGIGVAFVAHRLLLALEPGVLPRLGDVRLDIAVLGFAAGLSILTGLAFGTVPAIYGGRLAFNEVLQQGGRGGSSGRRHQRVREGMVMAQMALTLVLLAGAGLLTRTFLQLRSVDPGFVTDGVTAARVFLNARKYPTAAQGQLYYHELLERVRAAPGVVTTGATSSLPMDPVGVNFDLPFRTEATAGVDAGDVPQADFRIVTPGYFETMGVRLRAGRFMSEADDATAPPVALINQAMAEQHWPGEDPVGRRLQTVFGGWTWYEVIGVVDDTRYYGLDSEPRAEMYMAAEQVSPLPLTVVAKTAGDPGTLARTMNRIVLDVDPTTPAHSILPVQELIADTIATERFYATLLAMFAAVATVLAATGIYGVLSYWVSRRRSEIGVRMALGATRAEVIRLVVLSGMRVTGLGIVIGLIGATWASRFLANMLFGVQPVDPITFAVVTAVLGVAALGACYVPGFRAARVDPMKALREER